MATAHVGAVTIHYEIEGEDAAPPLLLLNSLGTSLEMWNDQLPELRRHFKVVRYDVRGHGRSSLSDTDHYEMATLGGDALAVLDAARIPIAHWCGLSLGGMTAMWAAVHQRERMARLALCNTSAHMPPPALWQSRIELVEREGMAAIADSVVQRWFTAEFRTASPDRVERIRQMLLTQAPRGYAAACRAIRDMDQREEVLRITAPTLIIGGSKDPATPVEHSSLLHARILGSRFKLLDAAHLSNVEQPTEFCAAILEFFCEGKPQ